MNLFKIALFSFFAAASLFVGLGSGLSGSVSANDGDAECQQECREQLADARYATAKYHRVEEALAAGYSPASLCVALPTGPAMGIHYVNFQKIADGVVTVNEPEVLVYLPDADGSLRLVAAEYMIPKFQVSEAPELFGQHFHEGPMDTWALHAWVWRNNPDGMFADFNPKLSCPAQ